MSPYVTHAHLKLLQSLRRLFLYKMNNKKSTTADKRQKRNARDRARRASETEAQREERLRKRTEKDRARKALVASSESQEERASRLEYKNALERQRLTDETDKERILEGGRSKDRVQLCRLSTSFQEGPHQKLFFDLTTIKQR